MTTHSDGLPVRGRGRGRPRGSRASKITPDSDRQSTALTPSNETDGGNLLVQEVTRGRGRGRGTRGRGRGARGGRSAAVTGTGTGSGGREANNAAGQPFEEETGGVIEERAVRTAVEGRKSTQELSGIQPRRTSAQVEQDKAAALAEAESKAAAKEKAALDMRIAVAGIEDDLHMEEHALMNSSLRPDLVATKIHSKSKDVTEHRPLQSGNPPSERLVQDATDYQSSDFYSDGADLPESSVADDRSSDGLGDFHEEDEEEHMKDVEEEDHDSDKDGDYVMPLDQEQSEESSAEDHQLKPQPASRKPAGTLKDKQARSNGNKKNAAQQFSEDIASHRKTMPLIGATGKPVLKRKDSEGVLSLEAEGPLKRSKVDDKHQARNLANSEAKNAEKDPLEYAGGEFDADERDDALAAARQARGNGGGSRSSKNFKAAIIRVSEPALPAVQAPGGGRSRRPKFGVNSLPFPRGPAGYAYFVRWRKMFKPTLIHWAGTSDDPFGSNSELEPVVRKIWETIYPQLDQELEAHIAGIVSVAGDVLIEWRSSIGKAGLQLVREEFEKDEISFGDAQSVAEEDLEGYRFIYADPYSENKETKGAFMSELVLRAFAAHLKKSVGNKIQLGYQKGGLAMATAAIERGFELVKSRHIYTAQEKDKKGKDLLDDNGDGSKKKKISVPGFTDALWGGKIRGWVESVGRLDAEKWRGILEEAVERMDGIEDGDEEDEDIPCADPRAMIDV